MQKIISIFLVLTVLMLITVEARPDPTDGYRQLEGYAVTGQKQKRDVDQQVADFLKQLKENYNNANIDFKFLEIPAGTELTEESEDYQGYRFDYDEYDHE
uniref:Uncharacterized protein n=1 Tax=Lutzomyia ayacuchensis TaxID=252632 RepID=L0MXG5_LUTAY|nr:hypothetical protein [Lutzomyia ayacuchensis]BAM69201.1 hypothetical protein [Lutzomyia ayacuchensis]